MSVRKVLVAGAGQMGAGIAQVAAQAGLDVVMTDVADEFIVRGMAIIEKGLGKQVEKGKLQAAERDAALGRIVTGTDFPQGMSVKQPVDFVESIPGLTERECEIMRLLIAGKSNKQIGLDLGLQEITIKIHLRNAYRKIGATNRADAVRLSYEQRFAV